VASEYFAKGEKMREWFTIGAKLLGVYFFYMFLSNVLGVTGYLAASINNQSSATDPMEKMVILSLIVSIAIWLLFSLLLLFGTEWLARLLRIPEQALMQGMPEGISLLRTGLILNGVYVFVTNIGGLVKTLYDHIVADSAPADIFGTLPRAVSWSQDFVRPGVTVLFSLFLIFASLPLARFLTKDRERMGSPAN